MEVEAVDEGKLRKILVDEGTEGVAVNTPIAVLGARGRERRRRAAPKRRQPAEGAGRGEDAEGRRRPAQPRARPPPPPPEPEEPEWGADQADHRARGAARRDGRWRCAPTSDVFLMGEEVAQYQGAYKISQGLLDEFGAAPRHRHADHRARLHRHGRGCGDERAEADRRVHDLQLRHAGDRPDHQLGRQDALYVRRPDGLPDRLPRPERRGRRASARSTASATRPGTRIARA